MIILGLGTNLGDRKEQLLRAVDLLRPLFTDMRCSPVYESPALLPQGATADWDKPFLNMAVRGETTLTPQALLVQTQTLEQTLGRMWRGHWGPREIDIDILAYDNVKLAQSELIIPHAGLLHRDFALIPLADIAPDWVYPGLGKTARELALEMTSTLKKTDIVIA